MHCNILYAYAFSSLWQSDSVVRGIDARGGQKSHLYI